MCRLKVALIVSFNTINVWNDTNYTNDKHKPKGVYWRSNVAHRRIYMHLCVESDPRVDCMPNGSAPVLDFSFGPAIVRCLVHRKPNICSTLFVFMNSCEYFKALFKSFKSGSGVTIRLASAVSYCRQTQLLLGKENACISWLSAPNNMCKTILLCFKLYVLYII